MDKTTATTYGPGVGAFVVLFLLAVAVFFLFRSMTYHLRKVRYSPDPSNPPTTGQGGDGSA